MKTVISSISNITADWLTTVLRRSGSLSRGRVLSVTVHPHVSGEFVRSTIAHLTLHYSSDAPGSAPRHILWKYYSGHDGALEISFYNLIATIPDPVPGVVPCYDAVYNPQSGESHCLLADLSATHMTPITRAQVLSGEGVPTAQHLEQIVTILAHFHAYWWEHPVFGTVPDVSEVRWWYRDREHFDQYIARRQDNWTAFLSQEGDTFPPALYHLYDHALAGLPQLWERYLASRVATFRQLSLANGDGYFNQYLCPTFDATKSAYLIDFEEISANFGASDLAYLFATFWSPEQRHEQSREELLLRHYHQQLCAYGVTGYAWDDLMTDYRLMITLLIFVPVWDQTSGASREYWWLKMRCLTAAYQDLGCVTLLEP